MSKLQTIGVVLIAIASALISRNLFPVKVQSPPPPPRIHTVYDTVSVLDTAWIEVVRERVVHDTVNLTEVVTVTVADTIEVCPTVTGVTAIDVGLSLGDSTLVGGFSLTNTGIDLLIRRWTRQYWTPGPLQSLYTTQEGVDVAFGEFVPPRPHCGLLCKLSHYVVGGSFGYGICALGVR